MKKVVVSLIFIAIGLQSSAQVEFSGKVSGNGFYSNSEKLPFWFYSNQRGRISDSTDFSGLVSAKLNYDFSDNSSLEVGGGLLYDDQFSDEIAIDELYAEFDWKWLKAIAGRKQRKELYNGLSATNENFAWSLNARPLPGIELSTSRPLFFNRNKKLGIEISWAEYFMGNDRFVKGARLHSKSLFLIYNPSTSFKIKGGISHYAIWGGISPKWGKQPEGFVDYLKIITGREGGDNSAEPDQQNVIGAHSGTYELYVTKKFSNYKLQFIYNHFFEDGTGSRYANFPDGRYGLFYEEDGSSSLINSAIFEFYYTRDQSDGSSAPHEHDFYFNSFSMYKNGWTYKRRIIGVPFFDYDYNNELVGGNKFAAYHLAFGGEIQGKPHQLSVSYVFKEGAYFRPYNPKRKEFYGNYEIKLLQSFVDFDLQLGVEFSNVSNPIFGTGLSISKQF